MAMVTKTVKLGIHKEVHAIKRMAMTDTQELYNRVIQFYMEFFVAHLGIFEEKVPYTQKKRGPRAAKLDRPRPAHLRGNTHLIDRGPS